MGRFAAAICLLFVVTLSPAKLAAISLECDGVNCGPQPGSSGYAGVARSRVIPQNSRGSGGAFGAQSAPGGAANNLGSQGYNYAVPIVQLPGRNGLNLSLTLYYNSRIWEIDRVNGTAILNADRDFPTYGFRLDFGFLELNDTDNVYILTEADGSKRRLVSTGGSSTTAMTALSLNTIQSTALSATRTACRCSSRSSAAAAFPIFTIRP